MRTRSTLLKCFAFVCQTRLPGCWLAGCWSAEGLSVVSFYICFITYWVFQLLINNPNTYIFYVMVIFVIFLVVPRVLLVTHRPPNNQPTNQPTTNQPRTKHFSQIVSSYFKLDFTTSWVRKRRRNTFGEFFWFASVCKTSSLKKQV